MSYKQTKNGQDTDIVVYDFEKGIAPSPHKGIANMQNANISTETGEIMASYGRIQQNQAGLVATIQTGTAISTSRLTSAFTIQNGTQITITASTVSGLSTGTYFVVNSGSSVFQLGTLQTTGFGGGVTWAGSSGTISYHITTAMSNPIASATESYFSTTQQFRYYILDSVGLVWVYDTALVNNMVTGNLYWYLPNSDTTYYSGATAPSGIAVLNGWVMVFDGATIRCKKTVDLTAGFGNFQNGGMTTMPLGNTQHFAFVGHQGRCYYTDGTYIGSIFPDSSLLVSGASNVQSYCLYTAVTVTGTVATLISGSQPNNGLPTGSGGVRVPAVFFTDASGVQPTNLTIGTVYYIEQNNGVQTFQVFAASTGGSAIDIKSGASGNQYFNTFYPVSAGGATLMVYTPQRVNLPVFEQASCMTEIGNTVIIGTSTSNIIYPWNQIDPTPFTIISLPENNTQQIITVNQMAYVFAGYKGNVYITDGNTASLVISVPDYCAGVPGTPNSYIEPTFTYGGAAYIRGRVYFSLLDQTTTKAGNCGGIWSFIPTQNLYIGQDTGLALRLENQNSYGTYNGVASLIIPNRVQTGTSPQYWTAWYSSVSSPLYGIDYTATTPVGTTVIESDFMAVGTVLNKYTPKQIEYKLATPLLTGETVQINWRKNTTDAWTSCGTVIQPDGSASLSGYFNANFQGAQWVQLQAVLTPFASTNTSFTRLSEIRMR